MNGTIYCTMRVINPAIESNSQTSVEQFRREIGQVRQLLFQILMLEYKISVDENKPFLKSWWYLEIRNSGRDLQPAPFWAPPVS